MVGVRSLAQLKLARCPRSGNGMLPFLFSLPLDRLRICLLKSLCPYQGWL